MTIEASEQDGSYSEQHQNSLNSRNTKQSNILNKNVNGAGDVLQTPEWKHHHQHHQHLHNNDHHNKQSNSEGAMFSPEIMNNAFSFRDDVLQSVPHDEIRTDSDVLSNQSYDKTPIPIEERNHSGGNSPRYQTESLDLGASEPPETPPNLRQANDMPTWLRRFKNRPSTSISSPDTYKWNEFKKAFKFGKGKKEAIYHAIEQRETGHDHSEEQVRMRASNLVTTCIAGAPLALIASATFRIDEHGVRRAPLLLSMVGLELEDVTKSKSKHKKYLLKLEYGVGPNRLKWSVLKDHRDFISLHSRLKVSVFQSKNFKGEKNLYLPKFPRAKHDENEHIQSHTLNDRYLSTQIPRHPAAGNPEPSNDISSLDRSADDMRSVDSGESHAGRGMVDQITHALSRVTTMMGVLSDPECEDEDIPYTQKLEVYMKKLMLLLSLRPEANRLFQFLELSPLGVLLSYENKEQDHQGKQGYLIVGSTAKAQGWRVSHLKLSDFQQMVKRHTNKWFLVRSSYILYVSDIYSTTPLDVFLIDSHTVISYNIGTTGNSMSTSNDNVSIYDDGLSLNESIRPSSATKRNKIQTHYTIKLENGERSLKLLARSENQARLWIHSLENMLKSTIWVKQHRFNSFAPVRNNCYAQWFVDGRDHFWAVSSAMEMAKDVIYIHDWWLSPELYMRRPANGNQEFRLDRILKRKAEQGVKIFVIIYRNVGATVVTDSLWTKHSLIDLHPNIHVIRSPNQWLQNTYFWAHHEKLCIVDHTVAFVGGIDLCYGRYDTPDHVLVDDAPHDFATKKTATEESVMYQKFPGKDYSNPRVKDFYSLDKPYESMYDREVVPRMPWHDVHMMTAGQVASDLSRHFVQRWNYLLRQKRPSRPTPLLTPPPDFSPEDLERFNLTGTCEVQLLRSAGNWSLGLNKVEKSIQDAYLKLIETSEHFVYIENQFFITSTSVDGTVIENRIGDALVDRIIRAHNERKKWKAVIIIPLMPGFESQVDEAEGSAVRVIMQCQYMSISRGETSIFGKLKKLKINPTDYIQFFSLRKWGRIGPQRKVVSEQLYIHAKILLVDDRTALIGSANINERSQRGNRDSEVAAIVRDTDIVHTTMNGEPYQAGKFCHTLRMRLMCEHLGVDVDIVDIVEKRFSKLEQLAKSTKTGIDSKTHDFNNRDFETSSSMVELASRDVLNMPQGTDKWKSFKNSKNMDDSVDPLDSKFHKINESDQKQNLPQHLQEKAHKPATLFYHSFNNRAREENMGIRDKKQFSSDARLMNNSSHRDDVNGEGFDNMKSKEFNNYKLDAARTLKSWAEKSMMSDANDVFLPHVEQVLEFLEDDSFIDNPECLTNHEEILLHERNQERWQLLKTVAYLQRVAAKQSLQNNDENAKRAKVGLPNVFMKTFHAKEKAIEKDEVSATSAEKMKTSPTRGADIPMPMDSPSGESNEIEDLPGDNIPVVSLNDEGIQTVLKHLNEISDDAHLNKFIDPYAFNDPLIDSFYEDIWVDNAIRNTLIFREVFHCQPDDTVVSWKQYKDFSKLSTAFSLAQDQEAARRSSLLRPGAPSPDDREVPADFNYDNRRQSIRLQDIKESNATNDGILGRAPPTDSAVNEGASAAGAAGTGSSSGPQSSTLRKNRRGLNALKGSPLGSDRVFDRETADRLLNEVQGHLVVFPVDWLSKEMDSGNWFYNMDRLPPIEIYN